MDLRARINHLGRLLHRSRRARVLLAGAVVGLGLGAGSAVVVSATSGGGQGGAQSHGKSASAASMKSGGTCHGLPGRDRSGVEWHGSPHKALRLKGDSLAHATHVALRWRGSPTEPANRGERVVQAFFVSEGPAVDRRFIRRMCGDRVARRTIFTAVQYPHAEGASLFVSKLFISRFPGDRYRVWTFLHS
jgi:hypothetical protein